ncbi:C4-dicarboxylate TRAP transporter substrate-binding protein [Pacificispira sp.]|uniref:C4-dicarboxylate TRAP transporter substrate-binding protein n=1 Tax=Pacificispira sp. TaxID=2888761 RepID=UPI003B52B4B1
MKSGAFQAMAIAAIVPLAGICGVAQAETELTFGSWFPAPHLTHKHGLEPYFERVEKDSGGSLKWTLFVGGAMGNAKASLANITNEVIDSSVIVDVYLKKDLPVATTIGELIALADDPRVFAAASNETQLLDCPSCEEERLAHNLKGLAFYSSGTYRLMCVEPIKSLKDVEGKKVRGASRVGALAQHLGGTPVGVTTSEQYEALQRGQVDCTLGSTAWLDSYNLKDVVKTIVDYPLGAYFNAMVMNMNLEKWNSLTDKERNALVRNLPGLVGGVVFAYINEGDRAIAAAVESGNATLYPASPDFIKSVKEFRAGEVDLAIEKAKQAGVVDPEGITTAFLENVEKWRGIVEKTGDEQAAYEKALWDEIFSKLNP